MLLDRRSPAHLVAHTSVAPRVKFVYVLLLSLKWSDVKSVSSAVSRRRVAGESQKTPRIHSGLLELDSPFSPAPRAAMTLSHPSKQLRGVAMAPIQCRAPGREDLHSRFRCPQQRPELVSTGQMPRGGASSSAGQANRFQHSLRAAQRQAEKRSTAGLR